MSSPRTFAAIVASVKTTIERSQNRQRATIKKAKHKPERTENFQPRKIKRERDTDRPRQNFVIIDIVGELNRINCFERSGVDENAGENKIENSPENTPNTQRTNVTRQFDVRCSIVRRSVFGSSVLLHPRFPAAFEHEHVGSCASLRRRWATSRLALQLRLLQ